MDNTTQDSAAGDPPARGRRRRRKSRQLTALSLVRGGTRKQVRSRPRLRARYKGVRKNLLDMRRTAAVLNL